MKVELIGSNGPVSGTMLLIDFDGFQNLVDCGLFSGTRAEVLNRNRDLPFEASGLHSVLLTRAHLLSSGNLPSLVQAGFSGSIFSTLGTQDLCGAYLRDAALAREDEAAYINARREDSATVKPLYSLDDAEFALYSFNGIAYNRTFHILRDLCGTFLGAGNMPGSSIVVVDAKTANGDKRLVYAGNLGIDSHPFLSPPSPPRDVHYLIVKSGIGLKRQEAMAQAENRLAEAIGKTVSAGGKIIVPGRGTGSGLVLIDAIHRLKKAGRLPEFPIYLDSPFAVNIEEFLRHHGPEFRRPIRDRLLEEADPFGLKAVHYCRRDAESKKLQKSDEPALIITPAHNGETGRCVAWLDACLEDPKNLILLIEPIYGNTLASHLSKGEKKVRLLDQEREVAANVMECKALYCLADQAQIADYVADLRHASPKLERVYVIPEFEEPAAELLETIRSEAKVSAEILKYGDSFSI
ncbi:MAG: hypothetical protein ACLFUS_05615 [Candidatus Sumerlaeia bacterium]